MKDKIMAVTWPFDRLVNCQGQNQTRHLSDGLGYELNGKQYRNGMRQESLQEVLHITFDERKFDVGNVCYCVIGGYKNHNLIWIPLHQREFSQGLPIPEYPLS